MMEGLPISVWSGSFHVLGVEIKCHTLSDGQRIIETDSMIEFLKALEGPGSPEDAVDAAEFVDFMRWQGGR